MPHKHGDTWRGAIRVNGMPLRQGGFATKAAAARWERETRTDMERGTWRHPDAGDILFAAWVKMWLTTRATLKPSAQVAEESICRVHLVPAFGHLRLDAIKPSTVAAFVGAVSVGRANGTVRNIHAQLYVILRDAVRDDLLTKNACDGTRLPPHRRGKVLATLTEQELARLLAALPDQWRPLAQVAAMTGMRWGELVGLRVRYVDLFAPTIRVEETANEARGVLTYGTPKSQAGYRTIDLPAAAVDALAPLVVGKEGSDLVFTATEGGPVRHRNFDYRVWQPACRRAGVMSPRPTFHDLRHTHAALLIAANVPLSAIKVRFGHESISTTDDTYGYLLPRVSAGIVTALDAVFRSGDPTVIPQTTKHPA